MYLVTPRVRGQLYVKSEEENCDWQEMLEVYDMMELSGSSPQTLSQRANSFRKIHKQMVSLVSNSTSVDMIYWLACSTS